MGVPRGLRAACVGALVAVLGTACGGSANTGGSGGGPEKTELTIGVLPIVDAAPLFLAKERGFFADEGLSVKIQVIGGSASAISKVQSGSMDITFSAYTSVFQAADKGLPVKVIADAYVTKPGVLPAMAMPDSGIRDAKDLAGKTVAVQSLQNVQTVLMKSTLRTHGVDPNSVEFVKVPFPEMLSALEKGDVDVATPVEPFTTLMEKKLGARTVVDLGSGATADWPIAGYVTSGQFTQENPKTVSAFQRAITRGAKLANDRSTVENIIPTYTEIDKETVALIKIGSYPTTVEPARLQRVSDLLSEFNLTKKNIDANSLIVS